MRPCSVEKFFWTSRALIFIFRFQSYPLDIMYIWIFGYHGNLYIMDICIFGYHDIMDIMDIQMLSIFS